MLRFGSKKEAIFGCTQVGPGRCQSVGCHAESVALKKHMPHIVWGVFVGASPLPGWHGPLLESSGTNGMWIIGGRDAKEKAERRVFC